MLRDTEITFNRRLDDGLSGESDIIEEIDEIDERLMDVRMEG